jgi:hypothetical protein
MAKEEKTKGIKVMALRQGFFGPNAADARLYNEEEVFEVEDESKLGSWMLRLDGGRNPAAEKLEKAQESLAANGYALVDTAKIRATPIASKSDKLEAAKKAAKLNKAAKEAKEASDEEDKIKSLI